MAFVRCSKRRGGTPTGERPLLYPPPHAGEDKGGGRAAPKRGSWTTRLSAFRLPFLFFLSCFFLGFAGLDRDERPDSTAGFAQRSPESKRFVPFSCRLPHASDADRIARTMALGLASPQGQRKSEPLLPSWPGLSRPSTSWALLQVRRGCPARGRA